MSGRRKDMAIPEGREMPSDERLTPPAWPEGRAAPPHGEFHHIGKRSRKVEGLAKVTGQAIYADDIRLPRMLHGKLLRSIHAHARILAIDASAALALPGVHAVITGKDLPEYYGIIPWTQDEQALCEEKGLARAYDYFERARRAIMDEGEPLIPETFSQFEERTIVDIVAKLAKYGSISDRQWAFVRLLLVKIDTRAERAARATAERETALPMPNVPVGERITIRGEIVSTRAETRTFGYRTQGVMKMLVKHADGWKVWGTMPAALAASRGDTIEFTAAVTRSDRDEKFGFFSRPTNARILTNA